MWVWIVKTFYLQSIIYGTNWSGTALLSLKCKVQPSVIDLLEQEWWGNWMTSKSSTVVVLILAVVFRFWVIIVNIIKQDTH